jgi:outer membrane protein OmpA-like peptidoglycan-associated protein
LPQAAKAQGAPGTQQMIDALKPANKGRNLFIRQAASAPAATAPAATPATPAAPVAAAPAAPAPAAPPAAAPAAPAASADAPSLSLAIQFETNSSRVRPESGALLGDLVAAMISPDLKDSRFVIEGHTDARGNAAANRRLSQERAEEVRQYLILLGVHASRLKAVGKGSSELANSKDPMAAENRRVRVVTVE